MYSTICKQNDNTEHQVAHFIGNGFTGILCGWWDNVLTITQHNEILNSFKIETNQVLYTHTDYLVPLCWTRSR